MSSALRFAQKASTTHLHASDPWSTAHAGSVQGDPSTNANHRAHPLLGASVVGCGLGDELGTTVGALLGDPVGYADGLALGAAVGCANDSLQHAGESFIAPSSRVAQNASTTALHAGEA